jgi:lysophospholipase L1-like esterase
MLDLSSVFSSLVFAETGSKLNLVALGDSITHGWNLGSDHSATQPINEQAFPYLIDSEKYTVTQNISGGGWTTTNLLSQLYDPVNPENLTVLANLQAIKNANVITLDIGNNDLLQTPEIRTVLTTPAPTADQIAAATAAAKLTAGTIAKNLTAILGVIRQANPDATVILYNLYNPFGDNAPALHALGEQIITQINNQVISPIAIQSGSYLADAHSAFDGHQAEYILPGDIHPTVTGHQVLAGLANDILAQLEPLTLELTPSTTEPTTGPVTINVSTNAKEVAQMLWLPGEKTEEDFYTDENVNQITDNKFDVTENGKYTVYVMDRREEVALKVIEVTNIKKDTQTPGDNGGQTPAPTPTPTPAPTPTSNTGGTGHALPDTATPVYNYLVLGLGVALAGFAAMKVQQFRRREN